MRAHPRALLVAMAATAVFLASCSTQPPRLNGRHRQPVNTAVPPATQPAVAQDANVEPPATSAPVSGPTPGQIVAITDAAPADTRVFRMHFASGRADFRVPSTMEPDLLALARSAQRVLVKGRTDGQAYSAGDEQVALSRALRARHYLIAHGVEATRIDVQFASAADYLAENTSSTGRAQNRRVEIELALPTQVLSQR